MSDGLDSLPCLLPAACINKSLVGRPGSLLVFLGAANWQSPTILAIALWTERNRKIATVSAVQAMPALEYLAMGG